MENLDNKFRENRKNRLGAQSSREILWRKYQKTKELKGIELAEFHFFQDKLCRGLYHHSNFVHNKIWNPHQKN